MLDSASSDNHALNLESDRKALNKLFQMIKYVEFQLKRIEQKGNNKKDLDHLGLLMDNLKKVFGENGLVCFYAYFDNQNALFSYLKESFSSSRDGLTTFHISTLTMYDMEHGYNALPLRSNHKSSFSQAALSQESDQLVKRSVFQDWGRDGLETCNIYLREQAQARLEMRYHFYATDHLSRRLSDLLLCDSEENSAQDRAATISHSASPMQGEKGRIPVLAIPQQSDLDASVLQGQDMSSITPRRQKVSPICREAIVLSISPRPLTASFSEEEISSDHEPIASLKRLVRKSK